MVLAGSGAYHKRWIWTLPVPGTDANTLWIGRSATGNVLAFVPGFSFLNTYLRKKDTTPTFQKGRIAMTM